MKWFGLTIQYQVYSKRISKTIYIYRQSNNPLSIKKQLPKIIEIRLSYASKSKDAFNTTKTIFKTSLINANYKHEFNRIHESKNRKTAVQPDNILVQATSTTNF